MWFIYSWACGTMPHRMLWLKIKIVVQDKKWKVGKNLPKKRYDHCMQIKLCEWKEVFRENHQCGGRLVLLLPWDQALTCVQDLGVCPGAVWNDKNLGGIVSTEEDQIITWKEFRWLCWLELIDIKWHLIVLSAKSSKVVSMRPVTRISSVRSLSAVYNRRERCGCSGCSEDTWEWALRYIWEGDHWNPWIPKENNMRNSGKCDNNHCTNRHTGCQYKSSTLLLEWLTDVLHSSGHPCQENVKLQQ